MSIPPEDKWLLLGLFYSTTRHKIWALLVVLLQE